jgi:hypothetical protein
MRPINDVIDDDALENAVSAEPTVSAIDILKQYFDELQSLIGQLEVIGSLDASTVGLKLQTNSANLYAVCMEQKLGGISAEDWWQEHKQLTSELISLHVQLLKAMRNDLRSPD